jgi:Cu/Ag efflux pump CusA
MLPFVIAGAEPGLEIVNPMAIVILGGLISTALLSLFVLPALYARFAADPPELEPEEDVLYPLSDETAAEVR